MHTLENRKRRKKMNRDPVIVSAVRTAIGKQGGTLATVPGHVFGAEVIKEAVKGADIAPGMLDDGSMGSVSSVGRDIAGLRVLETGLYINIAGLTVVPPCGSGLSAVALAVRGSSAGEGGVYIAGGRA